MASEDSKPHSSSHSYNSQCLIFDYM